MEKRATDDELEAELAVLAKRRVDHAAAEETGCGQGAAIRLGRSSSTSRAANLYGSHRLAGFSRPCRRRLIATSRTRVFLKNTKKKAERQEHGAKRQRTGQGQALTARRGAKRNSDFPGKKKTRPFRGRVSKNNHQKNVPTTNRQQYPDGRRRTPRRMRKAPKGCLQCEMSRLHRNPQHHLPGPPSRRSSKPSAKASR